MNKATHCVLFSTYHTVNINLEKFLSSLTFVMDIMLDEAIVFNHSRKLNLRIL